jgi:hypothetical protein
MTDQRLPTFLVIGAERAATRWLRNNLALHPDIHLPWPTEPYFAARTVGGSLRGYGLQFLDAGDDAVVGEVSPEYLRSWNPSGVSQRIHQTMPDVRLVAIVRQPVDRLVSAHLHHVLHGRISTKVPLFDLIRDGAPEVDRYDLVGSGRYAINLYPFRRRFRDQLLVVFVDDIVDDPTKVYDQVLQHIGAPVGFVPPHLDRVLYSNAHTRWNESSQLDDEQRRILHMLYRADIEELEAMCGRYLPSWDPGPPPKQWQVRLGMDERRVGGWRTPPPPSDDQ